MTRELKGAELICSNLAVQEVSFEGFGKEALSELSELRQKFEDTSQSLSVAVENVKAHREQLKFQENALSGISKSLDYFITGVAGTAVGLLILLAIYEVCLSSKK